jgi:hypothetical protein
MLVGVRVYEPALNPLRFTMRCFTQYTDMPFARSLCNRTQQPDHTQTLRGTLRRVEAGRVNPAQCSVA